MIFHYYYKLWKLLMIFSEFFITITTVNFGTC